MAITHEKMQVCGPVKFTHILDLSFRMRANQHGVMYLQGYINDASAATDCLQDFEGQDFCLFTLHEPTARERKPTFRGTADKFQVMRRGEVFLAKGKIIGATAELDITLKSRSFQNVDMTYRQVVEEILCDTPNASADFSDIADQTIGKPLIQYEETDWAFIKRLASMLGTQLIPDTTTPFPRFSFGQISKSSKELAADEYALIMDERFYELGSSLAGVYKPDFFCYLVPSYQFVQLGAQAEFREQSMVICEQDAVLQDGELLYSYKMGHAGWFSQHEIKNKKLIGLSLPGTVVETDHEIVCLKLDIDEGRNAGTYPFSWIPESGNIMYCMPKRGTRATLYIPSHNTGEAVAITSPRTNGNICGDMTDPQMRAFTTEHGKRMLLFPQSMTFSGGIPGETLQMKFDDIKCMSLESTRAIQIVAKLQVEVTAPRVTLNTPQQLGTSRSPIQASARIALIVPKGTGGGNPPTGGGDTVMFMEYQFDALGEQGILCGTEFCTYPPFDDEPTSFNLGGWLLNIAIGVAVAAVCIFASIATGGLVAAALAGAAMGALAVTATIAIEDYQDGEVRGWQAAVGQILVGATAGAAIGATGAYIMPHGVATMGTFVKFGMLSGTTMRVATSNAMEHMGTFDRLWYAFNPTRVLADGLIGGGLGIAANRWLLKTAFPSQEMVNLYNTSQDALLAAQAAQAIRGESTAQSANNLPQSVEEVDDYIASMGESIKSNPLRQEYETAVQNLSSYENQLRCQGLGDEEIARLMYEARRNLGIEYKDLTPELLREYIYEVNIKRYGDPLGGSFEFFVDKYFGDYSKIIESAKHPNPNVDKLLSGFRDWLINKLGL